MVIPVIEGLSGKHMVGAFYTLNGLPVQFVRRTRPGKGKR
jgi:hypothetical protein